VALPSGIAPLDPPVPAVPPVDPPEPPLPPVDPPLPPLPPLPPVAPVPVGDESSPPQFTSANTAPTTNNVPIVTDAVLIESS
jgi:hypothetical protein